MTVGARIDGVERPTQKQAVALRDLAALAGFFHKDLLGSPHAPKCSLCGRERTIDDAYDYNPLQAMTGKPLGWYSGDDGEVCPECMTTKVMNR